MTLGKTTVWHVPKENAVGFFQLRDGILSYAAMDFMPIYWSENHELQRQASISSSKEDRLFILTAAGNIDIWEEEEIDEHLSYLKWAT